MTLWALGHSALATERSKQLAARALGEQRRNGLYRISYNGLAVVTTAALAVYIHRLPDRPLYRLRSADRAAARTGQVLLLAGLCGAAVEIGLGPFSGVSELLAYGLGRRTSDAPEAQGPSLGRDGLRTGGPYRFTRHPLNFCAAAIPFFAPDMTVVRLTVALATLGYALIGSKIEEQRLLRRYGEPYAQYLRSGVPFFVPALHAQAPRRIG